MLNKMQMQKPKSEDIRQAIIDTALEIALKDGLSALSVRNISKSIGYTTGVIYHHFKDKDEIITEILQQQGKILMLEINDAAKNAATLEENFRAVYYRIFLLARQKPALYTLIAQSFLGGGAQASAPFASLESNLAAIYAGQNIDVHALAHAVWCSFIGFNLSIAQNPSLTNKQAQQLFEQQLNLILHGMPTPTKQEETK